MRKWICRHIPPHRTYVEVFGGAAHVLLHKDKSMIEVYNDINPNLVNLFKFARDRPQELIDILKEMSVNMKEFEHQKKVFNMSSGIDKITSYFYLLNNSMNARMEKFNGTQTKFNHKINNIHLFSKRMKSVIIENMDFYDVIKKYDDVDTVTYMDPPYYALDYYQFNFSYSDHIRLANTLKNIKGKFILSYYPHETIYRLYKGFNFYTKKFVKNAIVLNKKTYGTELLITNFDQCTQKSIGEYT